MHLACVDGSLVPLAEARLPVIDDGLLRGDGVFEVVRVYAGTPFVLHEHLERMQRSADNLRLPLAVEHFIRDAHELLIATRPGDCMLRFVATRGGHRITLLEALPEGPPTIALAKIEYQPTLVLDGVKSLSYAGNMLAGRLAKERGCDEALLVTPDGRVLEAPTSSFFLVLDGAIRTPPLSEHILDSITRRRVVALANVEEQELTTADLPRATGAFIASTTREVHPVHRIDDLELDPQDAVVLDAAARTRELIASELAAVVAE
jgi:branched-chain amino acid aminotransferase